MALDSEIFSLVLSRSSALSHLIDSLPNPLQEAIVSPSGIILTPRFTSSTFPRALHAKSFLSWAARLVASLVLPLFPR